MDRIPNEVTLELLVQAYYTNLERSELKSISLTGAFDWLDTHDLIVQQDGVDEYRISEKGRFYIDHILNNIPLPVEEKRWVILCE